MKYCRNLPLLGTVPALKKGDRDEDDDSLLAVASFDLEIPGVSIMLPSAHRLSQMNCSVYVSPDFESLLLATERVRPNAPSSCVDVCVGGARMQRVQWRSSGSHLTSRALTNWSGRSAAFISGTLSCRSLRAVAICCSISLGLALEGELGAILLRAAEDMSAVVDGVVVSSQESAGTEVVESLA